MPRRKKAPHERVDRLPAEQSAVAFMTMIQLEPPDGSSLTTIFEAAEYLALSRGAVYNLLHTGQLGSIHIGRARRIPVGELRRFVQEALSRSR